MTHVDKEPAVIDREHLKNQYIYDAIVLMCGGIEQVQSPDGDLIWQVMVNADDGLGENKGQLRLDAAVDFFLDGYAPIVIISGGQDPKNNDENAPTNASVYRDAFIQRLEQLKSENDGYLPNVARTLTPEQIAEIRDERLILEESSGNTLGSVQGILRLSQDIGLIKIVYVTEPSILDRTESFFAGERDRFDLLPPDFKAVGVDGFTPLLAAARPFTTGLSGLVNTIELLSFPQTLKKRVKNEINGKKAYISGKYTPRK